MVQVQVYSDQMPPKEKLQPKDSDALLAWVSSELKKHNASTLEDKLRYYKYANYTNHEKLFSGEAKDMPFTPARRWKINQFIYEQRVPAAVRALQRRDRLLNAYLSRRLRLAPR